MATIVGIIQLRYGLRAHLPSTALVGEAYFCTDSGELFVFDGSAMRNISASSAESLAMLTDVNLTALANGQVLTYDSVTGKWENKTPLLSNLGDLSGTPTLGKIPIGQGTTAIWADPVVQGVYPDGSNVATPPSAVTPTHINPVLISGKGADGNQHSIATDNSGNVNVTIQGSPAVNLNTGSNLIGQVEISDGTNVLGTNSHPVRTDPTGTTTQPVSGTVTTTPPSHASTNVDELNGSTIDTNSGSKSSGTLRVVIATDQPQLTSKLLVTADAITQSTSPWITQDNADATSGGTSAPSKILIAGGKTSDITPQYQPIPMTTGGAAVKVDASAATVTVSGTVTTTPPTHASTNVDEIGGNVVDTNSGNKSNGTLRVVLATDQPSLANKLLVTADPITFASAQLVSQSGNWSTRTQDGSGTAITSNSTSTTSTVGLDINIRSILGTAPTSAGKLDVKAADGDVFVRQTTGSNLHTVTDNGSVTAATLSAETTKVIGTVRAIGNAGAIIDGATASTVPANAIQAGARAATQYPTAVSDNQLVAPMADKAGRISAVLNTVRDLIGTASVQTTDTSLHTLIVAGGASVFNDIISLVITNESSTATVVSLSDGSTTYKFAIAANGGIAENFLSPLPAASAATAWTVQSSASVTLDFVCVFAKNK